MYSFIVNKNSFKIVSCIEFNDVAKVNAKIM